MREQKNYRKYFKDYYCIEFNDNYDIHHIDLNHNNNDINNLMLLPKQLHHKYHLLLNSLNKNVVLGKEIKGNYNNPNSYNMSIAKQFIEVMEECNNWYDYKLYLDKMIPNIHNIEVEE